MTWLSFSAKMAIRRLTETQQFWGLGVSFFLKISKGHSEPFNPFLARLNIIPQNVALKNVGHSKPPLWTRKPVFVHFFPLKKIIKKLGLKRDFKCNSYRKTPLLYD